jgi:signal transduction histidine kinase
LEAHTKTQAGGDLSAEVNVKSVVNEVGSLAHSIKSMASSLDALHKDATARERITTFGRVAAGLAHDLRLPIETVQDATQIILENPDDAAAMDHFRWTAENEIPKLQGYLDDLQHLATEGSVGLHRSRVDIRDLMLEVTATLSQLPKWEGVAFEVQGDAQSTIVDADLLRRAVSNLAANAADSTVKQGQGRVILEIADSNDAEELVIRVVDDGHGMTDEALAQVLSGDFRSTKRANGVGLGFGAARHIIQSHGGQITGSSEVGVGTTMEVRLPRQPFEDKDRDRALQE